MTLKMTNTRPPILAELVVLESAAKGSYAAMAQVIAYRCDVTLETAVLLPVADMYGLLEEITAFYLKALGVATEPAEEKPSTPDTETIAWLRRQFGEGEQRAD